MSDSDEARRRRRPAMGRWPLAAAVAASSLFLTATAEVGMTAAAANATSRVSSADADMAAAGHAPVRVVVAQRAARAGRAVSVQFAAPVTSWCVLEARLGARHATSHATHVTAPLIGYSFTLPKNARTGSWTLALHCGTTTRNAVDAGRGHASLRLKVAGAAKGIVALPRVIHTDLAQLTTHPGPSGLGAAAWPKFGTVLVRGMDWFPGHGVDVMSNGVSGCYDSCRRTTSYGIAYQCVELVNHFLMANGWSARIPGNARDIYANASPASVDKHSNGSGYIPVPGDVIVWSGGYGHVAVVEWVAGGRIGWVEQNASPTGRATATLSGTGALGASYRGLTPIGFLHAHGNQPTSVTTPPSPPAHNPTGALDSLVRTDVSTAHVVGWALDADDNQASITVRVQVDGQTVATAAANLSRGDVGPHGFDFTFGTDASTHQVCVQAVNIGGGTDTVLPGCATLAAASSPPGGTIAPPPAPNRTAIADYAGIGNGTYWGRANYAWQGFTAMSNTLTTAAVVWGSGDYTAGATLGGVTTRISLCAGVSGGGDPCVGRVADGDATVINYGQSSLDFGDIAVTPGTTYYVVYYQPSAAAGSWDVFWGSCPCTHTGRNSATVSDQMDASVWGYNR